MSETRAVSTEIILAEVEDVAGLTRAGVSPARIVAHYPGPALIAAADGTVLTNNDAGNALGAALLLGEVPELSHAVAQCAAGNLPGSERLELAGPGVDPGASAALLATLVPLDTEDGRRVLVLARDVTLERNMAKALLDSRQRYKDLVTCSTDFAWETNAAGRFGFVSPRGALGYQAFELEGRSAREFRADATDFDQNALEPAAVAPAPASAEAPVAAHGSAGSLSAWPFEAQRTLDSVEVWLMRKDGSVGCYEVSCLPVAGPDGGWTGARGVCRDVTEARRRDAELKRAYARLERLSRTDGLTGLLNRRAFHEALESRIAHLRRHGRQGALLYVDLDNFKAVNDVNGHAAGDAALRMLSEFMISTSRADDLVARLGGDEFAIWLEGTDIEGARSKAQALVGFGPVAHEKYGVPEKPLGISVGVVISDADHDRNADALLARADAAMYNAKRSGKGRATITLLEQQEQRLTS